MSSITLNFSDTGTVWRLGIRLKEHKDARVELSVNHIRVCTHSLLFLYHFKCHPLLHAQSPTPLVSQARLSHTESLVLYRRAFGSAESATSSIFIVGGLLEINALILHCSLSKLLAH